MRPDASGTHARKVACSSLSKLRLQLVPMQSLLRALKDERLERPVSRKSGDTGSRGEPLSSGVTAKEPSVQPPTGSQLAGALWRICRDNASDRIALAAAGTRPFL